MKRFVTLTLALCLPLTACNEHKNPVAEADPATVQQWLVKLESVEMMRCAAFWQAPENASADDLKSCEPEQQRIATAMNKGGFSNDEVLPKDLELKAVWMTYATGLAERAERQKHYEEMNNQSRENVKKLLPHLKEK